MNVCVVCIDLFMYVSVCMYVPWLAMIVSALCVYEYAYVCMCVCVCE